MATSALTGLGCCGQGAPKLTTPAHPLLSGYFGFRFSASSFPIELLFELLDPLNVALGPVAKRAAADPNGLRRAEAARSKPSFETGSVNSDQAANFLGTERQHIKL